MLSRTAEGHHPAATRPRRWPRSLHTRGDLALDSKLAIATRLGGLVVMPKGLRYVIYWAVGLHITTPNIAPRQRFQTLAVHIGYRSAVSEACRFGRGVSVHIGDDTMIGPRVTFLPSDRGTRATALDRDCADIHIGSGVWIGAGATLLPGARVADRCVVSAGSCVSQHCEAGLVYAGVPARCIGRVEALWRVRPSS